jgi:Ser/Thr protein kinase RdoA (MazF antagonist)
VSPGFRPLAALAKARPMLSALLGDPVSVSLLKLRPGRRATFRATGGRRSAVVKLYASDRVPEVASRLRALSAGPSEPAVPEVLAVDPGLRLLVLAHLPGEPLRTHVLRGDREALRHAGHALGGWHAAFAGAVPACMPDHTPERELRLLGERAASAPPSIGRAARRAVSELGCEWGCTTVVHRDLYEEQLLVGERVALIDCDDAAAGAPEIDVGNLLAHLHLLSIRSRCDLGPQAAAFLDGYRADGEPDPALLASCTALSALRLACIHAEPAMLDVAAGVAGVTALQSYS